MVRGGRFNSGRGGRGGGSSSYYRGGNNSNYRGRSSGGGGGSYNDNYNNHNQNNSRYHGSGGGGGGGSGGYDNSYDSRPSYRSYQGSNDRYQSSRPLNHKRSYESSRDRSSERKRSRNEGSRRSLEYGNTSGDYGSGGGGGNSRYAGNSSGGGMYQRHHESRNSRPSPPPIRSSSSSFRSSSRNNGAGGSSSMTSQHRSRDRMGPPKTFPPIMRRTIRGGGRGSTSTMLRGGGIRRTRVGIIRSTDSRLKRRIISLKSRDTSRRIKLARMRSSIRMRHNSDKKESIESDESNENPDENGNDSSAENDDKASATIKSTTTTTRDSVTKDTTTTTTTAAAAAASATSSTNTTTATTTADDKTTIKKEKNISTDGSKADNGGNGELGGGGGSGDGKLKNNDDDGDDNHDGDDFDDVDHDNDSHHRYRHRDDDLDDDDSDGMPIRSYKKSFIKLVCVHCRVKCITFKAYNNHLFNRTHKLALRRVALRQKNQLAQMRQAQRDAQREIEKAANVDDKNETHFCLLCRLNYRSDKAEHQASESHRKMKKFLAPYCSVCRITFKSPMLYESHRCSLEHIKKLHFQRKAQKDREQSPADEKEVNLEQFLTVDSIGDVDGHSDDNGTTAAAAAAATGGGTGSADKTDTKQEIIVGNEHVKKVETYYCELCHYYLSHRKEWESNIKNHCTTKSHLRAYLRYKENQNLKLAAEKIHRRHHEKRDVKPEPIEKEKVESPKETKNDDDDDIIDEKLWPDVDKDLGELLQEVGTECANDEEDESTNTKERFDRFKNTDKCNENETIKTGETAKVVDVKQEPTDAPSTNNKVEKKE